MFRVKEIVPAPAPSKEQTARIKTELDGNLERDALTAYVGALQSRLGSSINREAFDRLRGVTQ